MSFAAPVIYGAHCISCTPHSWWVMFGSDVSQGPQGPDGPAGEAGPEGTKVMMLRASLHAREGWFGGLPLE